VHDDLAAGRLVAPLELRLPTGRAYFLVQPRRRRESAVAVAWRDWLRTEIAATGGAAAPGRAAAKARRRAVAVKSTGSGPRAHVSQRMR
jgi:hypothetical protein